MTVKSSTRRDILRYFILPFTLWMAIQTATYLISQAEWFVLSLYDLLWIAFSSLLMVVIAVTLYYVRLQKRRIAYKDSVNRDAKRRESALRRRVSDLSSDLVYDWSRQLETTIEVTSEDPTYAIKLKFFDDRARIIVRCPDEHKLKVEIYQIEFYFGLGLEERLRWEIPASNDVLYRFFGKEGTWLFKFLLPDGIDSVRADVRIDKLVPISGK